MPLLPAFFRNRPFFPLGTERLILRTLQEKDAGSLAKLANNKRLVERLTRLPYPYTLMDAYKFIAFAQEELKTGKTLHLAIERRSDATVMGVVGHEGELGYWLGEEFWEQGYGKEAVREFVRFLFAILQQEEIRGTAKETNIASRRIFEGLGFRETGTKDLTSLAFEGSHLGVTYALTRQDFVAAYDKKGLPLVEAAVVILIDKEGKFFLAERPPGKAMAGVWEPPGGKIEPGEASAEAAVRELKEEAGVEVASQDLEFITKVSYPYEKYTLAMDVYLCFKGKGIPYGAEGQKVAWVKYDDLSTLSFFPATIVPLHKIADIVRERGVLKGE